jgi:hypothetical protein
VYEIESKYDKNLTAYKLEGGPSLWPATKLAFGVFLYVICFPALLIDVLPTDSARGMVSLLWFIQIISWTQLQFYGSGFPMFSIALAQMHGVFEFFGVCSAFYRILHYV